MIRVGPKQANDPNDHYAKRYAQVFDVKRQCPKCRGLGEHRLGRYGRSRCRKCQGKGRI